MRGFYTQIQGDASEERGQAWAMRTLADAAYITPDDHPLKSHFKSFLSYNLDWYNSTYSNNLTANKLGILENGYTIVYAGSTGIAPWQDDFFTSAIGHVAELGFVKAQTLLTWKSKFPILRMMDPNYCWIEGAAYSMIVRDTEFSPIYPDLTLSYQNTFAPDPTVPGSVDIRPLACGSQAMATALNLKLGEMDWGSNSYLGFPAIMQPAIAYAADSGAPKAMEAWNKFNSNSVKPDYENGPQFAIVPRF